MGEMGGSGWGEMTSDMLGLPSELRDARSRISKLERLTAALLDRVNQLVEFHGIVPIDPEAK